MIKNKTPIKLAVALVNLLWMCGSAGNICNAQSAAATPPSLSPDLQEVVKLSQAHQSDDVIINYVKSSGKSYRLSADDIISLSGNGISQGVINSLQNTTLVKTQSLPPPPSVSAGGSAPSVPPQPAAQTAPPISTDADSEDGAQVNFQYFHDQLKPYGTWVEVSGMGQVWKPSEDITGISPDWRPYYDNGQWVHTDNGLYWQSDYTWGDIPFHYGRWSKNRDYGWIWAPDYTWGPSWVFWRQDESNGYIGWAALPPGAVYQESGFLYNGAEVGLDYDFGLGEDCFVFAEYTHFHEHFERFTSREWSHHVGGERLHGFYKQSVVRNEFQRDGRGRFVNNGIGTKRVETLTKVQKAHFQERNPVGNREKLTAKQNQNFQQTARSSKKNGNSGEPSNRTENVSAGSHPRSIKVTNNTGGSRSKPAVNKSQINGNGSAPQVNRVFRPSAPAPAFQNQRQNTQNQRQNTQNQGQNNGGGNEKKKKK